MKSISLILVSILSASSPLIAQPLASSTEIVQSAGNTFQLGTAEIQRVRAAYNEGAFSEFLKEMDADYQTAKKDNGLEGLIELRKEHAKIRLHPAYAHSFRVIQDTRNQQLLEAIGTADSLFAQKVRSAAASEQARDEHLISLYGKVPGSGKDVDENCLIDLDLEYEYKSIHLDSVMNDLSVQERKEKHLGLEMDKMARIVSASQSFENKILKKSVERDAATLDARLARHYDMSDLNALARGKIKPASPLEEKSSAIIARSQSDLSELNRQLLHSIDQSETAVSK